MKLLSGAVLLAAATVPIASGCHRNSGSTVPPPVRTIRGSGVLVHEDRPVGPFTTVRFAAQGEVDVAMGPRESLRLVGEDNLLPYVVTETANGTLSIRTASGVDLVETWPIEFHLAVTELRRLEFTGVGSVALTNPVGSHLALDARGIGPVRGTDLGLDSLDVSLSGFSDMELAGQVDTQVVAVAGFGRYDARDLASREAMVTVTNLGTATVRVSERLEAHVGDGCTVYYIGDPIVVGHVVGTGRIVKL